MSKRMYSRGRGGKVRRSHHGERRDENEEKKKALSRRCRGLKMAAKNTKRKAKKRRKGTYRQKNTIGQHHTHYRTDPKNRKDDRLDPAVGVGLVKHFGRFRVIKLGTRGGNEGIYISRILTTQITSKKRRKNKEKAT